MAADNGVCWASLSDYPGFQKYIWREKAADVFAAAGAQVSALVEPLMPEREMTFLS